MLFVSFLGILADGFDVLLYVEPRFEDLSLQSVPDKSGAADQGSQEIVALLGYVGATVVIAVHDEHVLVQDAVRAHLLAHLVECVALTAPHIVRYVCVVIFSDLDGRLSETALGQLGDRGVLADLNGKEWESVVRFESRRIFRMVHPLFNFEPVGSPTCVDSLVDELADLDCLIGANFAV
mmetsp:Transcript_43534/g.57626  ORF Transcript_43534/g.57626 Transcript_43534/m.57626 type:complete len:180 (-) Transcript_43534:945-1484(-)